MSNTQKWSFALYWIVGLCCGSITSLVPIFMDQITADYAWGPLAIDAVSLGSLIQSAFLGGWVLGGVTSGILAERMDRNRVLFLSVLVAAVSTVLLGQTSSPTMLILLRAAAGIGTGASMVVGMTLGAESISETKRPLWMGLLANSFAVGLMATGLASSFASTWRQGVLLPLVVLPFCFWLPFVRYTHYSRAAVHTEDHRDSGSGTKNLARGILTFGCMLITVWAAMTWLPTVVANTTAASATLDVRGITMMLFGTGGIVGSLVSGFVVMRLRYRRSLLICYGGAALFLAILLLSPQSSLTLTLILVAVLSVFFGMSQAIMSSYIPFLFPHSVRYRYTGVSFNAGRVVTAISVANLGIIVPSVGGLEIALCLYTIPLLIGMAVTLRTPEPEYS